MDAEGWKGRELAEKAEISYRRLMDIFKMPDSSMVNSSTRSRIARSLGMTAEQMDEAWRSMPVSEPNFRRASPTHVQVKAKITRGTRTMLVEFASNKNETVEMFLSGLIEHWAETSGHKKVGIEQKKKDAEEFESFDKKNPAKPNRFRPQPSPTAEPTPKKGHTA